MQYPVAAQRSLPSIARSRIELRNGSERTGVKLHCGRRGEARTAIRNANTHARIFVILSVAKDLKLRNWSAARYLAAAQRSSRTGTSLFTVTRMLFGTLMPKSGMCTLNDDVA